MGFLDQAGNFFGDLVGWNQSQNAAAQRNQAQQNQQQASGALGAASGVSGTQAAAEAGKAGAALGEQMGNTAATMGAQNTARAARTSGVNKGLAAMLGGQAAGNAFLQGQQTGQGMGMQAYGAGADRQVQAANALGGLGSNQQQAGAQQQQAGTQAAGSLLSAAGGLFASDEDVKKGIKNAPNIDEILAKVRPVSFKYKEGTGEPPGEHVGVTAQDLEKTPMKENVVETPMGKMVDGAKQEGSNLNLIIQLAARVHDLEKQLEASNAHA